MVLGNDGDELLLRQAHLVIHLVPPLLEDLDAHLLVYGMCECAVYTVEMGERQKRGPRWSICPASSSTRSNNTWRPPPPNPIQSPHAHQTTPPTPHPPTHPSPRTYRVDAVRAQDLGQAGAGGMEGAVPRMANAASRRGDGLKCPAQHAYGVEEKALWDKGRCGESQGGKRRG